MQTHFQALQLKERDVAEADGILRKCVHCGLCTATCPTYVLLGDELDSPRGRIYLIKNMLESGKAPDERTVRHIDRCLTCLSCTTTCPSGVDYMHLVDRARARIEAQYVRPYPERLLRWLLAQVLPRPGLFRRIDCRLPRARARKKSIGPKANVGCALPCCPVACKRF